MSQRKVDPCISMDHARTTVFLEGQFEKSARCLWREAHFGVKNVKTCHSLEEVARASKMRSTS